MPKLRGPASLSVALAASLLAWMGCAQAQHITVDGQLSPAQTLIGPHYAIGANLGRQVGSNLFHSFGAFSLSNGDTATFSGPPSVTNVIGRVTGGTASSINGKIGSTIPGANLYLINPSGVAFGPHAQVNVSGSFQASSAGYIRMADGTRFQAENPHASTLTSAPPEAFGFLTSSPRPVTVNGAQLTTARGTLGLVGGSVTIRHATLQAPSSTVQIIGVGGPGEVPLAPGNAHGAAPVRSGNVVIAAGTTVNVSNQRPRKSPGSVVIHAANLLVDDSLIASDNLGGGRGGSIVLQASGRINVGDGAWISTATGGPGNAGSILLRGEDIIVRDGAQVDASTYAAGPAGSVTLAATGTARVDGTSLLAQYVPTHISADSADLGDGAAGSITIDDQTLIVRGNARITAENNGTATNGGSISATSSGSVLLAGSPSGDVAQISTASGGPGNGGSLQVTAHDISVLTGGWIDAGAYDTGHAGTVTVSASGSLLLRGDPAPSAPATFIGADSEGTGDAGGVNVSAGTISILDTAVITSSVFGSGQGGPISVTTPGLLRIAASPDSETSTGIVALTNPGTTGNAGSIVVQAGTIEMTGEGAISTTSQGTGTAGPITINDSGALVMNGDAGISSGTSPGATGPGGDITVLAGSVMLSDGANITSVNQGSGAGGNVTLVANGPVSISGLHTGLATNATGAGNAGTLSVSAPALTMMDGSQITGNTFGIGQGGDVLVTVTGPLVITGSAAPDGVAEITSATEGAGNAGSVSVSAGSIELMNLGEINAITDGAGDGGDVSVTTPGSLSISNTTGVPNGTGIAAQANAGSSGQAGQVRVAAGSLSIRELGSISSEADGTGGAGGVTVAVSGPISIDGAGAQAGETSITSGAAATCLGAAGSVSVQGESVWLSGGAIITSANLGTGAGGTVVVRAQSGLLVDGTGTAIVGTTAGAGSGGSVSVSGAQITVQNGGEIASSSLGTGSGGSVSVAAGALILNGPVPEIAATAASTGNAGTISIAATTVQMFDGAAISTEASRANGGNIGLSVQDLLLLRSSAITTSVDGAIGNGGNITIHPRFLVLDSSAIEANAVAGNGGNISITAGEIIQSNDSIIEASSRTGIAGVIVIRAPADTTTAALAELAARFVMLPALDQRDCAGVAERVGLSSLTQRGTPSADDDDDAPLLSHYFIGQLPAKAWPPVASDNPFDWKSTTHGDNITAGCR